MIAGLYIEINIVCSLILLILIYKTESNVDLRRRHNLITITMTAFVILFITDSFWMLIDSEIIACSVSINYFVNIIYFIMSGLGTYLWFLYCCKTQDSVLYSSNLYKGLTTLPLFALAVLTINSPITKWIFYIDENNNYHRGSLHIVQIIIVYSYVLAATIVSIYNASLKKNIASKKLFISFSLFMFFPIISTGLQIWLPEFSFASVGITLPCVLVYTTLVESQITTDGLTLLFNKNWLYRYYSDLSFYNQKGKSLSLIMLDIDSLSEINNNYGQPVGDKVINAFGRIIIQLSKEYGYNAVRYGGDEFIIVCEDASEAKLSKIILRINESVESEISNNLLPCKITVSAGYTTLTDKIKYLHDLVIEADEKMFISKKAKE